MSIVTVTACSSGRSAADYRSEANAICERGVEEVERIIGETDDPQRLLAEGRAALNETFAKLRAVEPPNSLAGEHRELARVGARMIEIGERGRLEPGHAAKLGKRYDRLGRQAEMLMTELGLSRCDPGSP